ncbi:hypothetical protein EON65_20310 [archaeon]|nr:MAG: hypothetical protein EON65_20310 [archaeon]
MAWLSSNCRAASDLLGSVSTIEVLSAVLNRITLKNLSFPNSVGETGVSTEVQIQAKVRSDIIYMVIIDNIA